MQTKYRFIQLLGGAQRRLQQWVAERTEELQLSRRPALPAVPTPAQSGVLFCLAKADGATMGELAVALDLGAPAMSGLVQRMEAFGWVQRRSCEADARTQRVWLLQEGRALLPLIQQTAQRIQAALTKGFTEAELQVVARWLQHVQRLGDA